jgi:cytochrome c biogenesis protein CcdA
LIIILGKVTIVDSYFSYFEAVVGVMLVLLGLVRLSHCLHRRDQARHLIDETRNHHLAYGVGLVHGLAGSGAMILLVMTEIQSEYNSILYLIIFGLGSVLGMLVAAGIFSLPFSRRLSSSGSLQFILVILSSALCIGYGGYIVIQNLV